MTEIRHIVILGGGAAGWLTAGTIAAEYSVDKENGLIITLIESPDVSTIGVGEGTWPSMRSTLKKIGLSETEFIRECDASFKQGSKFINWTSQGSSYYHPFTQPEGYEQINLAEYWHNYENKFSYADTFGTQASISENYLAPKQIETPEFAGVVNYGYHLDAGKFASFLCDHIVKNLGVTHIRDHVVQVNSGDDGYITSLTTVCSGDIKGDLFIDCSGLQSLLLGKHYGIKFKSQSHILFNDCAIAVQVPTDNKDPIQSCTLSTAQSSGWIWDIGLPTRRGVGHVYSSAHSSEESVYNNLRSYLKYSKSEEELKNLNYKKLLFSPGYREKFWHKNCVAVGMAAGFIEPLEATALVLVELSAKMISEQLPADRQVMNVIAKKFNDEFLYRWERIIEFLKLHYVLTKRQEPYWREHLDMSSMPDGLFEQLAYWQIHAPWKYDFTRAYEMFSSASYQFVLYGMGFGIKKRKIPKRVLTSEAKMPFQFFYENTIKRKKYLACLPTNRELLNKLQKLDFKKN